jgi:hypothetical protein
MTLNKTNLGWLILECKYLYYKKAISAVPDEVYDALERIHERNGGRVDVGFPKEREAGKLVMQWGVSDLVEKIQKQMPEILEFIEAN